jgi:Flp pilus assembly protein TadD
MRRVSAHRVRAGTVLLIAALAAAAACDHRGRASSAAPPTPAARAQALIDAGNQAFRTHDYGLAARRYAAAAVIREDDPAAYYGLGMALARLGRDEEARVAYARARALAQRQGNPAPSSRGGS